MKMKPNLIAVFFVFCAFQTLPIVAQEGSGPIAQAEELMRSGKVDQALKLLENTQSGLDGLERSRAYRLIADIYLEKGAGVAAQAALDHARSYGTDFAVTVLPYAKSLLLQAKFQNALSLLQGAEISLADKAEAFVVTGDAYVGIGQFKEAEQSYLLASEADTKDFQPHLGLARLALKREDFSSAENYMAAARSLAPNDSMVLYTSGVLARVAGEPKSAELFFEKSVENYSGNVWARLELAGSAIDRGEREIAEKHLDIVYEQVPRHPVAYYLSAVLSARSGDFQTARSLLRRAGRLIDGYLPALYVRGLVEMQLGNLSQARHDLERVISVRPASRPARLSLSVVYLRQEDYSNALNLIRPLLDRDVPDPLALPIAATAASALGRVEESNIWFAQMTETGDQQPFSVAELQTKISLLAYTRDQKAPPLRQVAVGGVNQANDIRYLAVLAAMQLRSKEFKNARELIERLFELAPERALPFNMKGTLEYQLGDFDKSVNSFNRAIEINGSYTSARRNRALSYMALKEPEKAIEDLKKVLQAVPDDIRTKAVLARALLEFKKYQEATVYFAEVARQRPGEPDLAVDYARALAGSGRKSEAIGVLDGAYSLIRENAELIERAGELFLDLDESAAAARLVSRLVAFRPEETQSHLLYARTLAKAGLYEGARRSLLRAKAFADKEELDEINWYMLEAQYQVKRYDEALATLEGLSFDTRPVDVSQALMGQIFYAAGRKEEALKAFESDDAGASEEVALALSEIYQFEPNLKQAIAVLGSFEQKHGFSRPVRLKYGDLLMQDGQYEKAVGQYEHLIKRSGIDASVSARLAKGYHYLGDGRSIEYSEKAYQLLPNNPFVLDVYGWIKLQSERKVEDGLKALSLASRRAPGDGSIRYHLGMAHLANGDVRLARTAFEEALKLGANPDELNDIRQQLKLLNGR